MSISISVSVLDIVAAEASYDPQRATLYWYALSHARGVFLAIVGSSLAGLGALGCVTPPDALDPAGDPALQDDADAAPAASVADPAWPSMVPLDPAFELPPWVTLPAPDRLVVSWRTVAETTGWAQVIPNGDPGDPAGDGNGDANGNGDDGRVIVASDTASLQHHATFVDLRPGTAYRYRIVVAGLGATHDGVFVTAGRDRWRFVHLAEFHAPADVAEVARFADEIRAFRPHLIIESGDMVDSGTNFGHWQSYFRTSAPWISNAILLPAHSNHVNGPGGNANLTLLFVLPDNERWYETRYGQAQILTLDATYDRSDNLDTPTEQLLWLADRAVAAADGDDDPALRIAAWHYPACSSRYQSRASSRRWVRDNLIRTIADNGGVDLVLVGHDKYYERSRLSEGSSGRIITHVMTNAGKLSPSTPSGHEDGCEPVVTHTVTRSVLLGEVEGDTINARVIDGAGLVLDAFTVVGR